MEHAERMCDRIIIIASGRKMFDGSLQEAFSLIQSHVRLATAQHEDLKAVFRETGFEVTEIEDTQPDDERRWWDITLSGHLTSQDVLKAAIAKGVSVEGFDPGEKRLRDVFVSLVNKAEQEFGAARHG